MIQIDLKTVRGEITQPFAAGTLVYGLNLFDDLLLVQTEILHGEKGQCSLVTPPSTLSHLDHHRITTRGRTPGWEPCSTATQRRGDQVMAGPRYGVHVTH